MAMDILWSVITLVPIGPVHAYFNAMEQGIQPVGNPFCKPEQRACKQNPLIG
jgi:hypothetical protein